MDTPGYFTTGRSSASGFRPSPCIKIATNTPMFEPLREDMDLDCGTIVDGRETIEAAGRRIFDYVLAVASGEQPLSEQHDYGHNEFVPCQMGAVM